MMKMEMIPVQNPDWCRVAPFGTLESPRFVVIFSRYRGQWLLSQHKARATWETQGGHIEPGETPLIAARRELWEESGARDFTLVPLFDYTAGGAQGQANGVVFGAEIAVLGALPESEMARTALFDALPHSLTYPAITPVLFAQLARQGWPRA